MKRSPLKRGKPLARGTKRLRRKRRVKTEHARPVEDDGFGKPYLAFIELQPCCAAHLGECSGDVVGHHVREGEHARIHRLAVPLCYTHHIERWHQDGMIVPMTRAETIQLFRAEIDRRQDQWRRAA